MCIDEETSRKAIGLTYDLGDFYDIRQDDVVAGVELWTKAEIQKTTKVINQTFTTLDILGGSGLKSKLDGLQLEAYLKASSC